VAGTHGSGGIIPTTGGVIPSCIESADTVTSA